MNGDEKKTDLLCVGEQVPSRHPVILPAPQLAVCRFRFGHGATEVWERVGGTASSGRAGSPQIFPASGSTRTPHPSLHHPASKGRGRKCTGLAVVLGGDKGTRDSCLPI